MYQLIEQLWICLFAPIKYLYAHSTVHRSWQQRERRSIIDLNANNPALIEAGGMDLLLDIRDGTYIGGGNEYNRTGGPHSPPCQVIWLLLLIRVLTVSIATILCFLLPTSPDNNIPLLQIAGKLIRSLLVAGSSREDNTPGSGCLSGIRWEELCE